MLLGMTQVVFEGIPTYPDAGRAWAITDKYKVPYPVPPCPVPLCPALPVLHKSGCQHALTQPYRYSRCLHLDTVLAFTL